MNIPNPYVPMLLSAVRDAVLYNQNLLLSETLREREDYEEHLVYLTQFFEYLKDEYKNNEAEYGLTLEQLLPDHTES
ncbi:hypothetical protein EXA23_04360 [Vibrio cincinnatiensis]|uniref:hypothetical protein n=1 Tax=Vibrio cincinnatiensis TaxID=675 RepID=UPI0012ACCD60|nr:hypothetical protein [Vibrio cincinnatiensis]MCG3727549.1 hypothetical protein [Vibrio cincinnatiensis]MCG3738095.1 hypothetical protein [Vibrio cincinnatiensis]MCG3745197.1 hypothetical protein [Vibrio cincinnatiensis]MCG3765452.1 hypothetical protein [Vibrio cincinnatiensis]